MLLYQHIILEIYIFPTSSTVYNRLHNANLIYQYN